MADKQIYELVAKTAKHKAVDTVVSSTSTNEMTKSTHELFLATELNPMSAPISTTYKALPFNPLRGRAVVANSTNTKAYGVRPVDLGQESVGVRFTSSPVTKATLPVPANSGLSNYSLSLYFEITALAGALFNTRNSAAGTELGFDVEIRSDTTYRLRAGNGTESKYIDFGQIVLNKKEHLIISCDLSGKINIFMNGILKISATTSSSWYNNVNLFANNIIRLAGWSSSLSSNVNFYRFDFFNYALSASDVSYYWNNGRPDLAIIRDSDKWGSNAELTLGSWGVSSSFIMPTDDGTTYHSGSSKATKFTVTATARNSFRNTTTYTIGKRYRFTVWTKAGTTDIISIQIMLGNYTNTHCVLTKETNPDGSGWDKWTGNAILTTNNLGFYCFANSASVEGNTYYIDDMSIVQAGSVADYSPASIADPALITGDITSVVGGNTYQVVSELSTTDRDTIGAPDIAVGTRFVATNATAYTITSGKVQLIAVTSWIDNSTNALNATVSGNPLLVKTQVEERQGQGVIDTVMQKIITSASANKSLGFIPAGWRVDDISLDRATQPSSNVTFSVGSTAGTSNIVNGFVYDRTFTNDTLQPMLRKYFSKDAQQEIFISSANWYGGIFDFTITLRRV